MKIDKYYFNQRNFNMTCNSQNQNPNQDDSQKEKPKKFSLENLVNYSKITVLFSLIKTLSLKTSFKASASTFFSTSFPNLAKSLAF